MPDMRMIFNKTNGPIDADWMSEGEKEAIQRMADKFLLDQRVIDEIEFIDQRRNVTVQTSS